MTTLQLAACSPYGSSEFKDGSIALFNLDKSHAAKIIETELVPSPSWLVYSHGLKRLFAASERPSGSGLVSSLAMPPGTFTLSSQVESRGTAAVHLCLDKQSRYLFTANYLVDGSDDRSVAGFAVDFDGNIGRNTATARHSGLGPDAVRQEAPHCHCVAVSPSGRTLIAVDLGTDSLYFYKIEAASGSISLAFTAALPAGTGPRHAVFHPVLPVIFITGELSSTLLAVRFEEASGKAEIASIQPATRSNAKERNYPSGLQLTNDGHHLLLANRGADTIAVFYINPLTGTPHYRAEHNCGGYFPRSIRFDMSGQYLVVSNQKSGNIIVFSWDFAHARPAGILWDIEMPHVTDALILDQ